MATEPILIKPRDLPAAADVYADDAIPTDNGVTVGRGTPVQIVNAGAPVASQSEAIAGVDNAKRMTALRVKQVLDNEVAPAVLRAQAWAESPTNPNPSDPNSKSAKTWAAEAEADAAESIAAAAERFPSRSAFVAWIAAPNVPVAGRTYSADGLLYVGATGATAIADMPGVAPVLPVTPEHFGAVADGSTDDRAAVQAAMDYIAGLGFSEVRLKAQTYVIGASGSQIVGRDYGLLLRSGMAISGDSMWTTVLKAKDGSDIDLINTERSAPQSGISIRNLTMDGNEATMSGASEGFNVWAWDITDLQLQNVRSLNPATWGIRVEKCSQVMMDNIQCHHSAETNSDCIHFVDTSDVQASNIWCYSAGDDAFIIEAAHEDVSNYTVTGLYVAAANELALAARGLLLLGDESVMTGARTISNVDVTGLVAVNCLGSAVVMGGSSYENVRISGAIRGQCELYGFAALPGRAGYPGRMHNCVIDLAVSDILGNAVVIGTTNGVVTDNTIRMQIYNPGDNKSAVDLKGDRWHGAIHVNYNPNSDKASPGVGISIAGDENDLDVSCIGADKNLVLAGSAQNNTFRLGALRGGVTNDLEISGGATGNRFIGGTISGDILNSGGVTNKFSGVAGADTYGQISLNMATEGDGTAKFAHGLKGAPTVVTLQCRHPGVTFHTNVIGVDATEVDVQVYNTSGGLVTAGTYNFSYRASL